MKKLRELQRILYQLVSFFDKRERDLSYIDNSIDISLIESYLLQSTLYSQYDNSELYKNNPSKPLIYLTTSGSTNHSKIVSIGEKSIIGMLEWLKEDCLWSFEDVVLYHSELSFGIHLREILGTLYTGGTIRILSEKDKKEFRKWYSYLNLSTRIYFIPSFLRVLYNSSNNLSFPNIKHINLGGESVYKKDLEIATILFPKASILVTFGSSELFVHGFVHHIKDLSVFREEETIPFGTPWKNFQVSISDEDEMIIKNR